MITDRDICSLWGRAGFPQPDHITDVMSKNVYACGPGEDILEALETMGNKKVRRLPVIDGEGQLVGILSMDDIVLHAENGKAEKVDEKAELGYGRTVDTLKGIYEHPAREGAHRPPVGSTVLPSVAARELQTAVLRSTSAGLAAGGTHRRARGMGL